MSAGYSTSDLALVKEQETVQPGPFPHTWENMWSSRFLVLVWSNPGSCSHLGSELTDGRYLSLSFCLSLIAFQINKYIERERETQTERQRDRQRWQTGLINKQVPLTVEHSYSKVFLFIHKNIHICIINLRIREYEGKQELNNFLQKAKLNIN